MTLSDPLVIKQTNRGLIGVNDDQIKLINHSKSSAKKDYIIYMSSDVQNFNTTKICEG